MSMISMFKKELDRESVITRKMLERIPDDKYDWKPHPKSMTIRQLSSHIAELPTWIPMTMTTDELDFATTPYEAKQINDTKSLMELFETSLQEGYTELKEENEGKLDQPWTLRNGDQVYDVSPKAEVIRMTLNQVTHHRAQLGVYLRLLDIPIPGSYGPSADDMSF
ncbi:DinB family protein [Taibaiella chishuiensis]|uniref:Putative damage-inducible protein DinB n=1 Tax=Taibaiella chishuiensis TaxID=1434707 RepID=A0A2P8CV97_9BACT|nr:DinB family protein [Taibaiella chishuiensis]PSK88888.1 putative damage-inducible protein DinB [Taibaiella chishuiensis]